MPNQDDILITNIAEVLGPEFARGLEKELRGYVDHEKVKHQLNAVAKQRMEQALGPKAKKWVDGLGELKLTVPARTFFRWAQQYPGCWRDKGFVDEFHRDNVECRG